MKKIFLYTFFLFLYLNSNGQFRDFKIGYIILENNDTLHGLIRDDPPELNADKVCYKGSNGNKVIYKPDEVKFFKRDTEQFIKVTIDTIRKKPISKLLILINDGRYKLLRYEYNSPMGGMSGLDSGFQSETDYYLMISKDIVIKILNNNYQQVLEKYYSDRKVNGKKYKYNKIEIDFNNLNK